MGFDPHGQLRPLVGVFAVHGEAKLCELTARLFESLEDFLQNFGEEVSANEIFRLQEYLPEPVTYYSYKN